MQRQRIAAPPIVGVCPPLRLARRVREPYHDPNAIAVAADAALDDVVGLQDRARIAQPLHGPLEDGSAGDEVVGGRRLEPQLRHNFLSQAIDELLVCRPVSEVRQWQDREPRQRRERRRRAWRPLATEAVAVAGERLYEARCSGIVAQRRAQPPDRGIQTMVEINESSIRPQSTLQLMACDDVAGAFEQKTQDLEGLRCEPPRAAALPKLP